MKPELKLCPFCGSKPMLFVDDYEQYGVMCEGCGMYLGVDWSMEPESGGYQIMSKNEKPTRNASEITIDGRMNKADKKKVLNLLQSIAFLIPKAKQIKTGEGEYALIPFPVDGKDDIERLAELLHAEVEKMKETEAE